MMGIVHCHMHVKYEASTKWVTREVHMSAKYDDANYCVAWKVLGDVKCTE